MQNSLIENIWVGDKLLATENLNKELSMSLLEETYEKINIGKPIPENFKFTFFSNDGDNFFGVDRNNNLFKLVGGDTLKNAQTKPIKLINGRVIKQHSSLKEIVEGAANRRDAIALLLEDGSVHLKDPKNSLRIGEINDFGIVFMNVRKIQMNDTKLLAIDRDNKVKSLCDEFFPDSFLKKDIKDISMSQNHILFLTVDNKLFFKDIVPFHENEFKELEVPKGVIIKKIFAGHYRSYIISEDGTVYAFGFNENLQLGVLSNDSYVYFFEEVTDLKGIKNIFCNRQDFTLFQTNLGNVYACGDLRKFGINGNFGFPRKISC